MYNGAMLFARILRDLKLPYHWCIGLLANLRYGFPSRKLRVIGVTGTDGKTTTATMLYHILRQAGRKVALISTVSAYIGEEQIDTGFHVTTPDPFALQRLLSKIVKLGFTDLVLEATSHGIHQHRLFGIRPEVAVVTNVTHEHLDYHGSYKHYLKVKASFLVRARTVLLNKTDNSYEPLKRYLHTHTPSARIVPYAFKTLDSVSRRAIMDRFPEVYNRDNAAAALTAAQCLNISTDVSLAALRTFHAVEGRMQEIPAKDIRVIVDFAHTPNGLESALRALRAQRKPGKKLIAVFGCAGLRDHDKRPIMGKIGSELADEAILTAEDPRTEDVNVIIRQIKEGVVQNHGHMHEIPNRRSAIQFAICTLAQPGDIVGIFGKGHEKSLNLDGKHELSWSDQREAVTALEKRRGK